MSGAEVRSVSYELLTFREGMIVRRGIPRRERCPRSRRAVGVGDVAGERGAAAPVLRGVESSDFDSALAIEPDVVWTFTAEVGRRRSSPSIADPTGCASSGTPSSSPGGREHRDRGNPRRGDSVLALVVFTHGHVTGLRSTSPSCMSLPSGAREASGSKRSRSGAAAGPRSRRACVGDVAGERVDTRAGLDAWSRRDIEALIELLHPESSGTRRSKARGRRGGRLPRA